MYYKWDDPFGGHCCDEMRLRGPDELHVTTHLTVGEHSCAYRVVYWREGSSGSGEELPPQPSSLIRSASEGTIREQDAVGGPDAAKAAAQRALRGGGRKDSIGSDCSDSQSSDTSEHAGSSSNHRGTHERRSSVDGRWQNRRVRPFTRVAEM